MTNDQHPRAFVLPSLILLAALLACALPSGGPSPMPPSATPSTLTATATAPPVTSPPVTPTVPAPAPVVTLTGSALLPAVVQEVDLGVRFEQPLQHAVALDADNRRIFISAPPDKTLILSAQTLRITGTLPLGGGLAIDRTHKRLFVGAPGGVSMLTLTRSNWPAPSPSPPALGAAFPSWTRASARCSSSTKACTWRTPHRCK